MVSILFIAKVLLVLNLFSFGKPLKKRHHKHLVDEARKGDSPTKRQYLYSPYRHMLHHYLRTDGRNPYARPFYYYKTGAHRRQSLPGVHPLKSFLSNPYNYEGKLTSNLPKYRMYAAEMANPKAHFDSPKTRPLNIRTTYKAGVPLQSHPSAISKAGFSMDEPSASGEQPNSADMKQGSFKIDDVSVKGFGTYQVKGDQVEVDINIRITPEEGGHTGSGGGSGEAKPTPGGGGETKPTSAPSAAESTNPQGGEVKPTSPSSGGEQSTTSSSGATTLTPSAGGNEDVSAFEQEALKAHNDYRARHDAPPMTLNKEMNKEAAEWAEELGANEKFEHSPSDKRKNQGENIAAWCDAKGETATQVTKRWYDEVCDPGYDFSRNDMDWGAGHFTQVVWKKSTELGIGFYDKKRDDGWVCRTIVARYREPGNGGGTFLENVKKGSFDKAKDCTKESKRYRVLY